MKSLYFSCGLGTPTTSNFAFILQFRKSFISEDVNCLECCFGCTLGLSAALPRDELLKNAAGLNPLAFGEKFKDILFIGVDMDGRVALKFVALVSVENALEKVG